MIERLSRAGWVVGAVIVLSAAELNADGLTATQVRGSLAPVAVPQRDWLRETERQRNLLAKGGYRVCFLGDSLTAFWPTVGVGSWELDMAPFRPVNAGIAGDRVENVHFRVRQAAFGGTPPEVFVIWCGTNNLAKDPPDSSEIVADGIFGLVATLRAKVPDARILLVSITPSGHDPDSTLRKRIRDTNQRIQGRAGAANVTWLDVHDRFLDGQFRWRDEMTLDGTHLSARGYEVLAMAIKAKLEEWLK